VLQSLNAKIVASQTRIALHTTAVWMVNVSPSMNAKEIATMTLIVPQMNVARIMEGVDLQKIAIEQKIA